MIKSITVPQRSPILGIALNIEVPEFTNYILMSGPNGCGKSTILRLLAGTDIGNGIPTISMERNNHLPINEVVAIRYLPQIPQEALFDKMSVRDNIKILMKLMRINERELPKVINDIHENIPSKNLSVGQQKMLLLSLIERSTIVRDHCLVLLDEPLAGLHPFTVHDALRTIKNISKNKTENVLTLIVDHNNCKGVGKVENSQIDVRDKIGINLQFCEDIDIA